MPTEPLIRKSTHDLAILFAGQVVSAQLSEEVESHFLAQKQEIIPALKRVFVLPGTIPLPAVPVELPGYPIEETDCFTWLGHMEQFARGRFGVEVNLREQFPLPTRLPWKEVLPIFDPVGLTNRAMVDKALKAQELSVYEGTNLEEFTEATAEVSRLYLIHRSPSPTPGTMGLPPKFAKQWFSGRPTAPLHLRGYGIGNGLLYKVEKTFLDPRAKTASWFPGNIYLQGGSVAYGCYYPGDREVRFYGGDAGFEDASCGFREAIALCLKP